MPTNEEIKAAMTRWRKDARSKDALKRILKSEERKDTSTARVLTYLAKADNDIKAGDIGHIVSWTRRNWESIDNADKTTIKARFQELRTSVTADDTVRAYLEQAMQRFDNIGDDNTTAMARLDVLLLKEGKDLTESEIQELERLLNRAKEINSESEPSE